MIYTVEASHCQLSCSGELNTKKRKFLVPLPKTREICSAFAFLVFSFDVLKLAIQSQQVRYNYKDLLLKLTTSQNSSLIGPTVFSRNPSSACFSKVGLL